MLSCNVDVIYKWKLEPNANTSGKAGLTDVHLICACTDPRAKALKHLPGTLKKYSWKALETVLLSDAASKVASKRQDNIDDELMPDNASNADGGSKNGGEAKDEGAGDKPKSLATTVLEGNQSKDEEDSQSDDDVRPSADKLLLCKEGLVRSEHIVETIAIQIGWNLS